ncbi:MAG: leucine-rich repeat protein [Clostridia bacterium]|nr:leucine-rich repeat protein [Clostridia bacterium]
MKGKHLLKSILSIVLCVIMTLGFGVQAQAAEDGDWLLTSFLLSLMEEYGLYDTDELLQLMDADSVQELYERYASDSSFYGNYDYDDSVAYYDDEGYAIYLDERSGFYYGLYEDDSAYITGYYGLDSGKNVDLMIPAVVEGYPVYDVFEYAFQDASGISSVTLQEGIVRISYGAFMGSDIQSLTLPSSLMYIEYDAFSGCNSLKKIAFSEGLEYIGECAFLDCTSLEEIILPDSLTEIDYVAFAGCTSLRRAKLGAGLSTITGNIFSFCPSLNTLEISAGNRHFVNENGLLINKTTQTLLRYDASVRNETSFTVPNGISVIGEMCFANAQTLKTVILSHSVRVLEDYALWGCVGMSQIYLGCVEEIGHNAVNANSMREVVLPDTLCWMDSQAFCLRSIAADIGGDRYAYVTPGTQAYEDAVTNGFVVLSKSEYQPPQTGEGVNLLTGEPLGAVLPELCAHNTAGFNQIVYSEHPHTQAQCSVCGEQLSNTPDKIIELSSCNQCFSKDGYYHDRAVAMAQLASSTYDMTGHGSGVNRLEIADDRGAFTLPSQKSVTESLILVSQTADGGLVLTISFEGSRDLIDDWLRNAAAVSLNGIHLGVFHALNRFLEENAKNQIEVELDILNGKYTVEQLLEKVKENPNAHLRLTGHSYGGALAQAFTHYAADKLKIPLERIETYSFASLVPFSHEFVLQHPEYADAAIYNYVNDEDIVPCVGVTSEQLLSTFQNSKNPIKAAIAFRSALSAAAESLDENAVNLFTGLSDNTNHASSVCTAGFTLAGSYIGKIIYLDKTFAAGHWHDSRTYLALVKATENPQAADALTILKLFSGDVKKAQAEFESLYESVDNAYNIAIQHKGSWYLIDTVPKDLNYIELINRWDEIKNEYCTKYDASDIKLLPDKYSVIGFAFNSPPAGDVMYKTINGVMVYPLYGEKLYDKSYFEKWVETRLNEYSQIVKLEQLTEEEREIVDQYLFLHKAVDSQYNIAVLWDDSWYLIDSVPGEYNYFVLVEQWADLKEEYCARFNADNMKLIPDKYCPIGFAAYHSPPAGDVPYETVNSAKVYPLNGKNLYDIDFFKKMVEDRTDAYYPIVNS